MFLKIKIIVNSKLDRAEKAMEMAENLLNNDKAMTYDLKKFFPITVYLEFKNLNS